MFAKAMLYLVAAMGGGDMAHAEQKAFSVSDICSYSGPDREYLHDAFQDKFVAKDQNQLSRLLGDDWNLSGVSTPKNIISQAGIPEKNAEKLSFLFYQKQCSYGRNTSTFVLQIAVKGDIVQKVGLEILYEGQAFYERGEPLDWRRFDDDLQLKAAVASLVQEETTEQQWDVLMRGGGFIRCKHEANADQTITSVYISPPMPSDSLAHTLGANFSPNGRPQVGAKFNASGRFKGFFKPSSTACHSFFKKG